MSKLVQGIYYGKEAPKGVGPFLWIDETKQVRIGNHGHWEEMGVSFSGSVAVPEQAPPPSTQVPPVKDAIPDDSWLKADIQVWLTQHSIDYPAAASKADLIALANNPPPMLEN